MKSKSKSQFPDGNYVTRAIDFVDAVVNDEEHVIEGHAAVYDQKTKISTWDGDFYEVIERGAFDKTDLSDVALLPNHDWMELPLARSRKSIPNSSMTVLPDEMGLHIKAKLDPEGNTKSKALISGIKRGDVTGMSFAFIIGSQEWENLTAKAPDLPIRRIKSIAKVIEVSAVTHPAYSGTDIGARNDEEKGISAYSRSLESDRIALERARSVNINAANEEIEALRLKIKIKGEMK